VIERAHPDHAATDHQNPNMRLHEVILRGPRRERGPICDGALP
jgi:hypothetical protein